MKLFNRNHGKWIHSEKNSWFFKVIDNEKVKINKMNISWKGTLFLFLNWFQVYLVPVNQRSYKPDKFVFGDEIRRALSKAQLFSCNAFSTYKFCLNLLSTSTAIYLQLLQIRKDSQNTFIKETEHLNSQLWQWKY